PQLPRPPSPPYLSPSGGTQACKSGSILGPDPRGFLAASDSLSRRSPAARTRVKFLLLTQYFPPEVGAAQTRLLKIAETLVELGQKVFVVTAMPNYPQGHVQSGYRFKLFCSENL